MRPFAGRRSLSICAALALSLTVALPAEAAGVAPSEANATQKKEAMDHFATGKRFYEARNWEEAIAQFRASLEMVNSPNARLELARSLRGSGALGDAWTEYGRVIDDATKFAETEARYSKTAEAATSERTEVEGKIYLLSVTIAHPPAGANLKVGGRVVPANAWSKPISTSPGAVDVVLVDASGKELARQTVAAVGGRQGSVALDAQPPAPPSPVPSSPDDQPDFSPASTPPPSAPSSGRATLRPYAYVAGGVGVVGLGLFTAFGVMSTSDFNDLKSSCPGGRCPSNKSGEINDGQTFQTVANIGLGLGIAGVVAGATLFALSFTGKTDTTGLVVGPSYLGVRGAL